MNLFPLYDGVLDIMKVQFDSIRTIYSREKENQSEYYEIFDFIIRNYSQIISLKYLYENMIDDELIQRHLCVYSEQLNKFRYDMIDFVKCGDIHLSYMINKCQSLNTIISVYKMFTENKKVREITKELHISAHTVQVCRYIAANVLAVMYSNYITQVA